MKMQIDLNKVSTVLPKDAARMLVKAASIDPELEAGESRDRAIAIDMALERIKRMYPYYFKH